MSAIIIIVGDLDQEVVILRALKVRLPDPQALMEWGSPMKNVVQEVSPTRRMAFGIKSETIVVVQVSTTLVSLIKLEKSHPQLYRNIRYLNKFKEPGRVICDYPLFNVLIFYCCFCNFTVM